MDKHKNLQLLKETFSIALDYLENSCSERNLRQNLSPAQLKEAFKISIEEKGADKTTFINYLRKIIEYSVNTNHPFFMNQMYGSQQLAALTGDIITSILNTSMYTYEVAPLMTLIEKECVAELGKYIWKNDKETDGIFTPGGSISNMMAMVMARDSRYPDSKKLGIKHLPELSIFVSDQSHYSFSKNGRILGFGEDSIVKVQSDHRGKMKIPALENAIKKEKKKNRIPLMLVGTAGLTISGAVDDLKTLTIIAKRNKMWYHVDAVYGGSLLLSQKHSTKLSGINNADSVSWNLHKMLGIPIVCAVLMTRRKHDLEKSFSISASYLFHDNEAEFDLGQKSLQCGRRVDALKLWTAWKYEGQEGFEKRIDILMEKTDLFVHKLKENDDFELFCQPETPIVCFQYKPPGIPIKELNELNKNIRTQLFEEGKMLFNYSQVNDKMLLRCVISDDEISANQIDQILEVIRDKGQIILKKSRNSKSDKKRKLVGKV